MTGKPHRNVLDDVEAVFQLLERLGDHANVTININIQSIENVVNSTLDGVNIPEMPCPKHEGDNNGLNIHARRNG